MIELLFVTVIMLLHFRAQSHYHNDDIGVMWALPYLHYWLNEIMIELM